MELATKHTRKWTFTAYAPFEITAPSWLYTLFVGESFVTYKKMNEWRATFGKALVDLFVGEYKGGYEKWSETSYNTTVNTGLDDILTNYWNGSTYTAQHYVGLTDGTPTIAAGDTMSSHAGWSEVTAYTESNRQDLTTNWGSVSSQSLSTSSDLSFSINSASTTVGGGFITTDNTKGGTSGTLIAVDAFDGGDRTLGSGDTLNISVTTTESSA